MAKKMMKMSRNQTRKSAYAGMASEYSKEQRNAELSTALGSADLKAPDVIITKELMLDGDGKPMLDTNKKPMRVERRVERERASVTDKVSHIETRAGKRARLKASKRKTVREGKHLKGACHNIGCRQCSKQWTPMPSTYSAAASVFKPKKVTRAERRRRQELMRQLKQEMSA